MFRRSRCRRASRGAGSRPSASTASGFVRHPCPQRAQARELLQGHPVLGGDLRERLGPRFGRHDLHELDRRVRVVLLHQPGKVAEEPDTPDAPRAERGPRPLRPGGAEGSQADLVRVRLSCCGKRLVVVLRTMLPVLGLVSARSRSPLEVRAKLLTISAATIDRLLQRERARLSFEGALAYQAGHAAQAPDPDPHLRRLETRRSRGSSRFDLVAHDGGDASGRLLPDADHHRRRHRLGPSCTG